jgi:hypothetical protein
VKFRRTYDALLVVDGLVDVNCPPTTWPAWSWSDGTWLVTGSPVGTPAPQVATFRPTAPRDAPRGTTRRQYPAEHPNVAGTTSSDRDHHAARSWCPGVCVGSRALFRAFSALQSGKWCLGAAGLRRDRRGPPGTCGRRAGARRLTPRAATSPRGSASVVGVSRASGSGAAGGQAPRTTHPAAVRGV